MEIKTQKRVASDPIQSGSLSDLAFLLIIYFIVIAGFNVNQGFILSLPQPNSTKIMNIEDITKVYLLNNGSIQLDNKIITLEELEQTIKFRVSKKPNMTLLLKIYPEVNYQYVVDIVHLAKNLNIDNFSFSMIKDKK